MLENFWANAAFSVTPTILVGLIFWFVMRGIFRADRTERKIYAEMEAEERAKRGLPPKTSTTVSATPPASPAGDPGSRSTPLRAPELPPRS